MKCEYDMCINSILQMKKAGYISQEAFPYNGHIGANQTTMFGSNAENRKGAPKGEGHNAITSFDSQGRVFLSGFRKVGDYEITDHKNGFAQRAWWVLGGSNGYQKEFWNADFDANLNNHNVIIFGKASAAGSGLKAESAIVSAKLTSELDAKIDDGRPGTGKIVALKSYHALKPSATANEINNNCYDGDFANVTRAIYSNSNDLKYGCNIIKVMEDVK